MDVVVAAGGAEWEAAALSEIAADESLNLTRRCVDAADLLSIAGTRLAEIAFVDAFLSGLDVDLVAELRSNGIDVVALGGPADHLGIDVHARVGGLGQAAAACRSIVESHHESEAECSTSGRVGRIIAVWGPAGAPGRSTLAVNLAASWAASGRRCVLVDADTCGGTIAQILAVLDETSGVMAACRSANAGRTDEISASLLAVDDVDLLTGIPRPDLWPQIRPSALEKVLDVLAGWYDVVIVDVAAGVDPGTGTGPSRDQATRAVLSCADEVVVVGRADPPGLTRLVRALTSEKLWAQEPKVILNQVRSSPGWDVDSLATLVHRLSGHRPLAGLPADEQSMERALLSGKVLRQAAPQSALTHAIDRLAQDLAPTVLTM